MSNAKLLLAFKFVVQARHDRLELGVRGRAGCAIRATRATMNSKNSPRDVRNSVVHLRRRRELDGLVG